MAAPTEPREASNSDDEESLQNIAGCYYNVDVMIGSCLQALLVCYFNIDKLLLFKTDAKHDARNRQTQ